MDSKEKTAFAHRLRREMTEAERRLWHKLRDRRLGDHKFVRQMPIGPYVADFCCREVRLVVEVDGSHHATSDNDGDRDAYLVRQGYRILRFWNHDVLAGSDDVGETIVAALDGRLEPYERYRTT